MAQHPLNRHPMRSIILVLTSIFTLVVFSSCQSTVFTPEHSTFLQQPSRLQAADDVPFRKSWRSPNLDWSQYQKVVVHSVSLEHLRHSPDIEDDSDRRAAREEAAAVLGQIAETAFIDVFANDRQHRFEVVEAPGPHTVTCEIALTELIPAKPLINAAATGAGLAGSALKEVALNAGGAAAKSTSRGVIAIEVQFKDSQSGRTVFMFADQERGRPSLLNVKDFQKLGHAKAHIKTWAKQTLAVIKKTPNQKILDPLPVDIKPW